MKFGRTLLRSQIKEWSDKYLPYKKLKKLIKNIKKSQLTGDKDAIMEAEVNFMTALDTEVNKVVEFYKQTEKHIMKRLVALNSSLGRDSCLLGCMTTCGQEDNPLPRMCDLNAEKQVTENQTVKPLLLLQYHMVSLLDYLHLNITGLRKILKKHDKNAQIKLSNEYLLKKQQKQNSLDELRSSQNVQPICDDLASAISLVYRRGFIDIQERNKRLANLEEAQMKLDSSSAFLYSVMTSEFPELALGVEKMRWLALRAREEDDEEPYYWSAVLILMSTMLFMMNMYIVVPTAHEYTKALGGSASGGGIIIGMTPLATMAAAITYSFASQKSFREPLSFSVLPLLIGNMMYSTALGYNAMWMLYTGRLMIGLGSTRAIGRRFLMYNTNTKNRLRWSAGFVGAGALGCALGPATASLTGMFLPAHGHPGLAGVNLMVLGHRINTLTCPGWIMAVLWLVYQACFSLTFEEPLIEDNDTPDPSPTSPRGIEKQASFGRSDNSEDEIELVNEAVAAEEGGMTQTVVITDDKSESSGDRLTPDKGDEVMLSGATTEQILDRSAYIQEVFRQSLPPSPPIGGNAGGFPTEDEKTALLGEPAKQEPGFLDMYGLVMVCLAIQFLMNFVRDGYIASCPIITGDIFHWTSKHTGWLIAGMSVAVIPSNLIMVRLGAVYEPRSLIFFMPILMLLSCAVLCEYDDEPFGNTDTRSLAGHKGPDKYHGGLVRYSGGSFALFMMCNMLEGINMTLLSVVAPSRLSKRVFNAGLLVTLAGSFGRTTGASMVSVIALIKLKHLTNNLAITLGAASLLVILLASRLKNVRILSV